MVVLVVLVVTVVVVLSVAWLSPRPTAPPTHEDDCRTMVELHGISRRFQVAQFKVDLRREAAAIRRQLSAELDEAERRERGWR